MWCVHAAWIILIQGCGAWCMLWIVYWSAWCMHAAEWYSNMMIVAIIKASLTHACCTECIEPAWWLLQMADPVWSMLHTVTTLLDILCKLQSDKLAWCMLRSAPGPTWCILHSCEPLDACCRVHGQSAWASLMHATQWWATWCMHAVEHSWASLIKLQNMYAKHVFCTLCSMHQVAHPSALWSHEVIYV